jgi:hypothetical protein
MSRAAPKVFISYRREETAGHAGRLYDVMSTRFGDGNVFMDVDLAPGVDFVNRITEAVGGCHVLLVIMGPRWATISNGAAAVPRLAQPGDYVALEVETGLRRADVTVIPVLVGGAKMPDPATLPATFRALTRRNALELSDTRWRYDVDRLLGALDNLLAGTSATHKRPVPPPPPQPETLESPQPRLPREPPETREPRGPGRVSLVLSTTLVAAAAGLIGRSIGEDLRQKSASFPKGGNGTDWPQVTTKARVDHIVDPLVWRGFAWVVVGAAVALWLTVRLRNPLAPVGRLILGALAGVGAGLAWAVVYAVPVYALPTSRSISTDKQHLLLVAAMAAAGAVIGGLAGWVWRRRGSAGFAAGLLAGGLWEAFLIGTDLSGGGHDVAKAAGSAAVVVGFTALTQAMLDAREATSSGAVPSPSAR